MASGKRRDIIVVGASAGGVEALKRLVRSLPQELAAAVFVVLHVHPDSPSILADILQRETLRAEERSGSSTRPAR